MAISYHVIHQHNHINLNQSRLTLFKCSDTNKTNFARQTHFKQQFRATYAINPSFTPLSWRISLNRLKSESPYHFTHLELVCTVKTSHHALTSRHSLYLVDSSAISVRTERSGFIDGKRDQISQADAC